MQVIAADKQTVLKTLSKGDYFGEIAIFMHTKRISYVQAKEFCVVSVLKKTELDEIVLNFPEVSKMFEQEAEKRIKETKAFEKKRVAETESNEDDDIEDEVELSFIEAINNKLENSYMDSPMASQRSLIENVKRRSENIDPVKL